MIYMTDEHPAFRAELTRIEEEKNRKLSKTKHMFKLHRENEQANFECERDAAIRTCQVCQKLIGETQDSRESV